MTMRDRRERRASERSQRSASEVRGDLLNPLEAIGKRKAVKSPGSQTPAKGREDEEGFVIPTDNLKKAQKKARQKERKEAERIEKEFSKDLDEDDISPSHPPPLPQRQSTRVRDTKKGSDKEKKESSNSKSAAVKSVDKKPVKK